MPQPAELLPKEDPLVEAYRSAWEKVNQLWQAVADDPLQQVKARRLQEIQRSIARSMSDLDSEAADWVANSLPDIYAAGMGGGAGGGSVGELVWTQIHQQASQQLAQDLFTDLLDATKGVNETTKSMVRAIGKDAALQQAIAGRTAQDAAREMRRLLEDQGIFSVIYRDGSKHGLAEYSQVAIRTKSAVAYNSGTLNQHPDVQWWEVFDGPDCGWSYHDDPTLASGLIVTRDQAAEFPISHPNCRRAFGPRPDITSAQQVADLAKNPNTVGSGNVTTGQRDAQKAADQAARGGKTSKGSKTSKTGKKGPTGGPKGAAPDVLPSPVPDALDDMIDKSKFEQPKQAFGPGVKNKGYARKADIPSITDLIDAGWSPGEAVTEWERLGKNAGNVERRAKKKLAEIQAKNSAGFVKVADDVPVSAAEDVQGRIVAESHLRDLQEQDAVRRRAELQGQPPSNPLILHDHGLDSQWYDQLKFDGDMIPVKDLTIEGYKVKYGVAIRRNGRSYLLEVDRAEDITSASLLDLGKHIQTVEGAFTDVPEAMRGYQRGVAIVKGANPQDAFWAKQYNTPGFKSAATGGGGSTTFWGTEPRPGTILHEFGHNVDSHYGRVSESAKWDSAGFVDSKTSGFHKKEGFSASIYGHPIMLGESGVTSYGQASRSEDFAESVRLYMADHHNGYLGYTKVDGAQVSVRFADVFPERAKILDDLFGFKPVENTAFTKITTQKLVDDFVKGDGFLLPFAESSKTFGVNQAQYDLVKADLGPKALAEKKAAEAAKKIAEQKAQLLAEQAAQAATKAAEDAAKAKAELTYGNLTLGDKTSIGLKKKNAYSKALKMGATEDEAKVIADTVYDKELQAKLVKLAEEKGIDPKLLDVPTGPGQLRGGGTMSPNFTPKLNTRANTFVTKAGKQKHPEALAQASTATQAKANIAAELATRLRGDPNIRSLLENFDGVAPGTYAHLSETQLQKSLDRHASDLVQRWAESSGDSHAQSLVLQMAIKEEFGLSSEVYVRGVSQSVRAETEALYLKEGPLARKFVRQMYEHTQEELAKEKITEVSLYRGMRFGTDPPEWLGHKPGAHANAGRAVSPQFQPANSWSTQGAISQRFGPQRFTATVPADRVIGTARTGFGCLNEREFVVMDTDGLAWTDSWGTGIPGAKTDFLGKVIGPAS